jgi:HlyD family secretion protein
MDIVRTSASRKIPRRLIYAALVLGAIVLASVAFARLEPAAPPVEATSLVIESVERGPLTRAVRGSGVLVPENVRWIAAATDGRVERVLLQPGTRVAAGDVLIELSDPQQQQSARDAEWQLRAAEAAYQAAQAELESQRLDQQSATARRRAEA